MDNLITRIKLSIRDARALEDLKAQNEKNIANIDYLAMMADIDIPTEKENEDVQ